MKKVIAILLVLVLSTILATSVFAGGPVDKATGYFQIFEPWDGGHREIDFNAHENSDTRDAKGSLTDSVYGPDGLLRRVFEYDIQYVRVDGDVAHIGAFCTYDSSGVLAGNWLYVKVHDGGTPGDTGDTIGWKWGSEAQVSGWVLTGSTTGWTRIPIAGNLVVHN